MRKQALKVLFAAYECVPFYKSGGLADVVGSLPKALKGKGVDIRIIMPYYSVIKRKYPQLKKYRTNLAVTLAGETLKLNIFKTVLPHSRVIVYLVDVKKYFQVKDIFDKNMHQRFIAFSEVITQALHKNYLNWQPEIIHTNDWQTGLIAVKIKLLALPYQTLFTIHNIGYAGRTALGILRKFKFNQIHFSQTKNNKVNIMREAILSAHKINTVSPNYAKEILTYGYGYDMVDALNKRKKDLSGIINGIDYKLWSPDKDNFVKVKYNLKNIRKKADNKLYLQKISSLDQDENIPLIGMVSRLAGQKGFDILAEVFDKIINLNLQLVILGTGSNKYEEFFKRMTKKYKHKFKAHIKFDSVLAHQIYAGSDMFLMPSKYEPCGLGQLIAMRYGSVPIVRATGGLKDTVEQLQVVSQFGDKNSLLRSGQFPLSDAKVSYSLQKNIGIRVSNIKTATGFNFRKYDNQELLKMIQQAIVVFHNKKIWQKLIKNGMSKDFSWRNSAREYRKLYLGMLD